MKKQTKKRANLTKFPCTLTGRAAILLQFSSEVCALHCTPQCPGHSPSPDPCRRQWFSDMPHSIWAANACRLQISLEIHSQENLPASSCTSVCHAPTLSESLNAGFHNLNNSKEWELWLCSKKGEINLADLGYYKTNFHNGPWCRQQ